MSEHLHPGLHPDPDSLSAFIEGMLPEHERLQCLAHLAECSRCREVIFLAQDPPSVPPPANPTPAWRRWFTPVPVLAAAAAACIAVVAVSWYLHRTSAVPPRELVAGIRPAAPAPAPPMDLRPEVLSVRPATPKDEPRTSTGPVRAARKAATDPNAHGASAPTATPVQVSGQSELIQTQLPPALLSSLPLPATPPSVSIKDERASADGRSGVAGTITDSAGAPVPGASITLRQPAGTIRRDVQTDIMGQFKLTGLPAGHYELQVTAPGFRQIVTQVDVTPLQVATVSSVLEIGAVTESVEVTAAIPTLQAESSMARGAPRRKAVSSPEPRPLPSKLPAIITVTSGKVMLAVDSSGALFRSRNAGKGWKAVKPAWSGRVVHLITLAEPAQTPAAVFQLTTDADSIWLSRDGSHWYAAPPQR